MSRYDKLLELIDQYKPKSIIEIGVWNGANAIRMINRAKQYHPDISYTGYDLFEDATSETDAVEFNVKGHNSARAVAAYIKASTGVEPAIVKGNTNETLKQNTIADFVFLDGGHSVETIFSDYNRIDQSSVVVLDDYYTDGPDTRKYGCNNLVEILIMTTGEFKRVDIIPPKDPVKGGGYTQLVLVCR
jgi:predicted O-methyltransferase YrrM